MAQKRIVVLKADGTERELTQFPSMAMLHLSVGGSIEHVRVVDRVMNGQPIYTSMYVNEEGLIDGKPRNEKATELYQRAVHLQYPNEANPFKTARDDYMKTMPEGMVVISTTDDAYDNDPYICGDVVYFEGWTEQEVESTFERNYVNNNTQV